MCLPLEQTEKACNEHRVRANSIGCNTEGVGLVLGVFTHPKDAKFARQQPAVMN